MHFFTRPIIPIKDTKDTTLCVEDSVDISRHSSKTQYCPPQSKKLWIFPVAAGKLKTRYKKKEYKELKNLENPWQ